MAESKTIEVEFKVEDNTGISFDSNQKFIDNFVTYNTDIKKSQTNAPTHNPVNYKEQFYFQDDGTLWVNINNSWKSFTGSGGKVSASNSATQTITGDAAYHQISFNTEAFDTLGEFATNVFTAKTAGYYFISSSIGTASSGLPSGDLLTMSIYVNTGIARTGVINGLNAVASLEISTVQYLAVGGTVEIKAKTSGSDLLLTSTFMTQLSIYKI